MPTTSNDPKAAEPKADAGAPAKPPAAAAKDPEPKPEPKPDPPICVPCYQGVWPGSDYKATCVHGKWERPDPTEDAE